MKAAVYSQTGPADVLKVLEVPVPLIQGTDEVRGNNYVSVIS